MCRKIYVPAWKDERGNRLLMPFVGDVHESEEEARDYQATRAWNMMVAYLLSPDGIYEADEIDGEAKIDHVECRGPWSTSFVCVSGPLFEQAQAPA